MKITGSVFLLSIIIVSAMVSCVSPPLMQASTPTEWVNPSIPPNLVPKDAVIENNLAIHLSLEKNLYRVGDDIYATVTFINIDPINELYFQKYFIPATLQFHVSQDGRNIMPVILGQYIFKLGPYRFVALWPNETLSHTEWINASEYVTKPGVYMVSVTYRNEINPDPEDYTHTSDVVSTWHGTITSNVVTIEYK